MPGFIRTAADAALQRQQDDDRYWQALGYVFELIPPTLSSLFRTLCPILIGPTELTVVWDFAQSVELAQDAGIHIAEYGMILGHISISVDTGASRRTYNHDGFTLSTLSGQRRWERVQKEIFRAYSQLKQDSSTSAGTLLVLHCLKDAEAYVVVPDRLTLSRSTRDAIGYPYSVELTIVDRYESQMRLPSPDVSLMETIKGPARAVRAALQKIQATLNDLTSYADEARMVALAYTNIISDVGAIADAAAGVLDGTSRFIRIPHATMAQTLQAMDQLLRVGASIGALDESSRLWFSDLEDQVLQLASFKERFVESLDGRVEARRLRQQGAAGYTTRDLSQASGTLGGTGARSTDALRAQAAARPQETGAFSGWQEIEVAPTDTPEGLAARYGAAWADIAAANGLRAPYISEARLPATVAPGGRIVVPTRTNETRNLASASGGARAYGESQQDELFGRDLRIDSAEGVAIDVQHGSEDLALISGVDNVVQALGIRLDTIRGTNALYPDVGREDTVGGVLTAETQMTARVELSRTALQDARIRAVQHMSVEAIGDALEVVMDLELADRSTTRAQGRVIT